MKRQSHQRATQRVYCENPTLGTETPCDADPVPALRRPYAASAKARHSPVAGFLSVQDT